MQETFQNWLMEKIKVNGVLACGVRSPDRRTFSRSLSAQFQPVALENAFRCVGDTFQILASNRLPTGMVRWVYENYFLYGAARPDGNCFAVLTRRNSKTPLEAEDIQCMIEEFLQLET